MPLNDALDSIMEATVVPSFSRIGYEVRSRLFDWEPPASNALVGRTVVISGANSGLGLAAATRCASLGATVVALVRSEDKGEYTARHIANQTGNASTRWHVGDLTRLADARRIAAEVQGGTGAVDVLVHNAGAMFDRRRETPDGIERTIALHVVAPFVLTSALLEPLRQSSDPRVITVTSGGMYTERLDVDRLQSPDEYRPSVAYARAKRAQVALNRIWADREPGIAFHAMHPGWALTPGVEQSLPRFRTIMGPLLRTPAQGADTIVWLATADDPGYRSGELWLDRRPRAQHKLPTTRVGAAQEERLWEYVTQLAQRATTRSE